MNRSSAAQGEQTGGKPQTISEKIRKTIDKTQQELEELILQLSLGKADASVKYEEIKKSFVEVINEWKAALLKLKNLSKEEKQDFKSRIEELELQLSLGKAEAKDAFLAQRKKIAKMIHRLEDAAKKNPEIRDRMNEFEHEIEKFKLKLEILAVKFELKKIEVTDDFEHAMLQARIKIDKYFLNLEQKINSSKLKYSDFASEIKMSFNRLKQAINKL